MLPSVGPFAGMAQAAENVDEGQLTRVESIINSMTQKERLDHEIINGNRRKRIAKGSGTTVQDVNNLLRQYAQMRKMFKTMGSGGSLKAQQRMMSQMQGPPKIRRIEISLFSIPPQKCHPERRRRSCRLSRRTCFCFSCF
jgi:signal recognition particle subunit SRP54